MPLAARTRHNGWLVQRVLELHKRQAEARTPADRGMHARQIEATDGEIDALVYGCMG